MISVFWWKVKTVLFKKKVYLSIEMTSIFIVIQSDKIFSLKSKSKMNKDNQMIESLPIEKKGNRELNRKFKVFKNTNRTPYHSTIRDHYLKILALHITKDILGRRYNRQVVAVKLAKTRVKNTIIF